jgi:hypothetical protein
VYPHGIFVSRKGFVALAYPQDEENDEDDVNGRNLFGGFERQRFVFYYLFVELFA